MAKKSLAVLIAIICAAVPAAALASGYDDFARGMSANNIGDSDAAIAAFSLALDSGDLNTALRPNAYVGRAIAYARKEKCVEARSDVEAALALKPEYLQAKTLHANMNLCLGQFAPALAELTALIAHEPDAGLYSLRGQVYWRSGDFSGAAADFAQLVNLQPTNAYGAIWLAIAAARVGTFNSEQLKHAVSSLDEDHWPSPILHFLAGQTTLESVDAAAAHGDAQTVIQQKCEADFYLAEWSIDRGDTPAAKPRLNSAAASCPHTFVEYAGAKIELRRLNWLGGDMRNIFLLAVLCLGALPANAEESCRLLQMAVLDMTVDAGGGVDVPMTVSGQSVNMLVDTGGIFTMLTEQTVKRLGLKKLLPSTSFFEGHILMFGGKKIDSYTEAHDVDLGGLKAADIPMQVMPDGMMPPDLGGTIAPNILSHYDADFDFANAKFRLFSQDHCEGKVVYWTTEAPTRIPIIVDGVGHIEAPVLIDGKEIKALIDTGSSRSMMSLETARRLFGFDETDARLTPVKGAESEHAVRFPFAKMSFQEITVDNPDIVLMPDAVSKFYEGAPKLILGMGILRQLHLYIAYREHKLYVTAASAH